MLTTTIVAVGKGQQEKKAHTSRTFEDFRLSVSSSFYMITDLLAFSVARTLSLHNLRAIYRRQTAFRALDRTDEPVRRPEISQTHDTANMSQNDRLPKSKTPTKYTWPAKPGQSRWHYVVRNVLKRGGIGRPSIPNILDADRKKSIGSDADDDVRRDFYADENESTPVVDPAARKTEEAKCGDGWSAPGSIDEEDDDSETTIPSIATRYSDGSFHRKPKPLWTSAAEITYDRAHILASRAVRIEAWTFAVQRALRRARLQPSEAAKRMGQDVLEREEGPVAKRRRLEFDREARREERGEGWGEQARWREQEAERMRMGNGEVEWEEWMSVGKYLRTSARAEGLECGTRENEEAIESADDSGELTVGWDGDDESEQDVEALSQQSLERPPPPELSSEPPPPTGYPDALVYCPETAEDEHRARDGLPPLGGAAERQRCGCPHCHAAASHLFREPVYYDRVLRQEYPVTDFSGRLVRDW